MLDARVPRSQARIQSVSRAMALLTSIAESRDGPTAKALADVHGLSSSTTYHLLTSPWVVGIRAKDGERIFRIGPKAEVIADAYSRAQFVPPSYSAALHEVVRRTGETGYLGSWRGDSVHVLE